MTSPTNLTSSIQVTEEMIEAGKTAELSWNKYPTVRPARVEAIYLAMRSKDHSIAVDDVERVIAEIERMISTENMVALHTAGDEHAGARHRIDALNKVLNFIKVRAKPDNCNKGVAA